MKKTTIQSDPCHFSFSTTPENYHHLKFSVNDDEATIALHINPEHSLAGDTPLKLNSYDLGVDIELADAINRLRFEYPNVRVATITSGNPQVFSSGANIYMLKKSSHAFKVNFCKYTNETRLFMEEASRFSDLKFLAALNGTAAGGGYELALACDRVVLLDDKFANVSLPEVPLLGVLPGTGGLTRLVDKRKVRRDIADIFCTLAEGVKGERAKIWGLVDHIYSKSTWDEGIASEARALKKTVRKNLRGIKLQPIAPEQREQGFSYHYVNVDLGPDRVARITIKGPQHCEPSEIHAMLERGEKLWLLQAFRELDDAILRLRFFHREYGLWQLCAVGDKSLILAAEAPLYQALAPDAHWFLREVVLHIGRVFRRLDTSSRTMISIVEEESAFVGVLAELLLASDRSYAKVMPKESGSIALSPMNQNLLATWNGRSRLETRFDGHEHHLKKALERCDTSALCTQEAHQLGILTFNLDHLDFADEVRLFKEERVALSPDALSAMEANLRFNGPENLATKIFGRLSAWQNWVFIRENATGESGALSAYGEGRRPQFDFERC